MDITNEIQQFIQLLGFTTSNSIQYQKEYKLQNYTLKINLKKGKIYYRSDDKTTVGRVLDKQIQIGDKTTSNFVISKSPTDQENFVVLEVVDRLLEKGYLPNDIHLERRYPSGRGASGGKSDVCIYGKDEKSLMVIECKTWGSEFEKERKKMDEHGGQLFAYLANDQNTKFLVLYTSKTSEKDAFDYENLIVHVKDRKEDLKKSLKQIEEENIKLYRDANNKAELFEVWKESFNRYFHFNGIFDDDANAYSLELKALKKKNLKPLDNSQGLFNKFAEILRHNNISDNANAFNKILSLFLCKIVDEEKNDEEVLDFQVKEDEEYEHLIDRLQALYQKGMKKLNEEIIYYSETEIQNILKLYPTQITLESVENVFKELKYYTNNEFAFKEVHNKKLFNQNGRVLNEIVKLIQNHKFKYNSQQQVLGDFFELMLNHGVKQSEGQFFTPIPIVKYIILSLGFEEMIQTKLKNDEDFILPKILDYACGAGHFLTESIEELQHTIKSLDISKLSVEQQSKIEEYRKGTQWTKDYIFGIEKDYRLARTSQIACYINGDGDANILFGDGLENHDQLQIEKKKIDIVIANPPYSVDAFKNYLNIGKTNFTLFEHLTERSSQIEALFIERTKQVLADKGLAGIVLPSTILSNTGVYTKAREILLKYFEIKAITELGSKTFIATGTTTVILFLKRRSDDFLKDRQYFVDDLFNNTQYPINVRYVDIERFLKMFTDHRDFDFDSYKLFLNEKIDETLAKTAMFIEYDDAFNNSTEIKNLKKKAFFTKYNTKEKETELTKRFYSYCKDIEKEKCFYFMLCLGDGNFNIETIEEYYKPQQTVIVKTGNDINKQKEFLGYEFQGKKGHEGIKINTNGGKLFDKNNLANSEKANSYIRQAMTNNVISKIDESQKEYTKVYNLVDLLDFEKVEFEKVIKTNAKNSTQFSSKYEFVKLENYLDKIIGATSKVDKNEFKSEGRLPIISQESQKIISGYTNKKIEPIKDLPLIVFGDHSCNFKYIDFEFIRGADGVVLLKPKKDFITKYLYYILLNIDIQDADKYMRHFKHLKGLKIPLPPLKIQEKIITEIEKIEEKETKGLEKIEQLNNEIQTEFKQVVNGKKKVKIDKVCISQSGGTPSRNENDYWENGTINWLRSEVCQNCYVYENQVNEKITALGLEKSSAKLFKEGTILMALVGMSGVAYLTFESATNQNVAGLYPKDEQKLNSKFLFYALMNDWDSFFGDIQGKFKMTTMSTVRNLEIPLPTITEQKKLISTIEEKEKKIDEIKLSLENIQTEKENVLKHHL